MGIGGGFAMACAFKALLRSIGYVRSWLFQDRGPPDRDRDGWTERSSASRVEGAPVLNERHRGRPLHEARRRRVFQPMIAAVRGQLSQGRVRQGVDVGHGRWARVSLGDVEAADHKRGSRIDVEVVTCRRKTVAFSSSKSRRRVNVRWNGRCGVETSTRPRPALPWNL